jgi:hypothetical protein
MDGYILGYEYQNGVKLAFMQSFFHPGQMPGGSLGPLVYGTKGGVDMSSGTYYPREPKGPPVKLVEGERGPRGASGQPDPHIAGFLNAIRTGAKTTADLRVGCTAALTCILGREAIYRKRTMTWAELGVDRDL